MDERLKKSLLNLKEAVEEALGSSEELAQAVEEIQKAGYLVSLSFDVSVQCAGGMNPAADTREHQKLLPPGESQTGGEVRLTEKDKKFLKSLKIRADDEEH